ncbi:MAG: hypothetical protein JRK53_19230 [Deltaproteobacteria bacterium]|nr:hypothetical protein [Deltaproteobacteria bacterium]
MELLSRLLEDLLLEPLHPLLFFCSQLPLLFWRWCLVLLAVRGPAALVLLAVRGPAALVLLAVSGPAHSVLVRAS